MSPRALTRHIAASECGAPCRFCLGQHDRGCVWVSARAWVKRHPIGVLELLLTGRRKEALELVAKRWDWVLTLFGRLDNG